METLEKDVSVIGDAQKWLASYLSERKQRILIKNHKSDAFNLRSGVPKGSCLGPVLFLLYAAGLFKIIDRHLPNVHSYADDTQIYLSFRPNPPVSQDAALGSIENCVADVRAWMLSNRLLINDTKMKFVIIGSRLLLVSVQRRFWCMHSSPHILTTVTHYSMVSHNTNMIVYKGSQCRGTCAWFSSGWLPHISFINKKRSFLDL